MSGIRKEKAVLTAMVVLSAIAGTVVPGNSAAFHAWQVADVPQFDALNVRESPTVRSPIVATYENGMILSLTGACTSGIHLDGIASLPDWLQRQKIRHHWCEAWVKTGGQYRTAWVYGRYIAPYQDEGWG